MSIFTFTLVVGCAAVICCTLSTVWTFIIIVAVGIIAEFIYTKISIHVSEIESIDEEEPNVDYVADLLDKANKKRLEKFTEVSEHYNFKDKGQIPVKVNQDTGTYVVDTSDVIDAINTAYEEMMKYESQEPDKKG